MTSPSEFIGPSDRGALVALSTADFATQAREALLRLGYKVHQAGDAEEFATRFGQVEYQVVVLDEQFGTATPGESEVLARLQKMPMNARRHATIILIGSNVQTMNSMQAFQQSVHAVINYTDFSSLEELVPKIVQETELLLRAYREAIQTVQARP